MRLSTYARLSKISYMTAWHKFKNNLIPGAYKLPSGTIVIPDDHQFGTTMGYAKNDGELNTLDFVIVESTPGPKLLEILSNPSITKIVVTSKDVIPNYDFVQAVLLAAERTLFVSNT